MWTGSIVQYNYQTKIVKACRVDLQLHVKQALSDEYTTPETNLKSSLDL